MRQLDGKKAIVTGASRGIGKDIAIEYARQGADVALIARSEDLLNEVAAEVVDLGRNAVVKVADVTDEAAITAAVLGAIDGLGGVDVVVNNAGGNSFSSPIVGMRFSGWQKTQRLNVDSTVHVLQAVGPVLMGQKSGSVINVASVAGLAGAPMMSHYGAAKAAIISLTRSVAVEWAWAGVRVNTLLPGWIQTELTQFLRDAPDGGAGALARVPMQRWGQPAEIAAGAVFLASDASSFMTGQELVLDGGLTVMP
ncbi:MAG: SDR family oxidoreductase [Actinobacteria bacterium]|jgi:2-deoxy-D-gluconate 3-dehydrogenase|nr:SDR family oxidoreductase [Micrococcales bacterium]MCB0903250.1 SDR family oxidoreductase [Actinomycetota bacterium]MCO5298988.1 SDR family oxidoreductase [Candidatus Nanopelagicales bacterium]HPE11897.1 SDR family NAD(P)-dependent oxidoreductase [Actinomycetota bacterium]HPJ18188.1 SDR family NAD(P)-dependent oxidoreductase [Actinomycetota bacterium]